MRIKLVIAAIAAAILGGCVVVPEHGRHHGWHDRGWHDRGWHDRGWRDRGWRDGGWHRHHDRW